ncbi:MAG TPA: 30S ribosomal protein S4 [Candidatus Nanoarchaeia archaeon]|nr:30S ribosomal protein S4 [Candidatus Nanoarchaeia archaeon]
MGDTKKFRKKYQTPAHPWNKARIEEEKILVKEYGLVKKKEIQIATSFLKKYKDIAKKLIADPTEQGAKEKEQMLTKLKKLGLISQTAALDDVLGLEVKDILERRVQTLLFRKGLAKSPKQARQFITHGHVIVGGKAVTSPSTLVSIDGQHAITFKTNSPLLDEGHPERISVAREIQEEKAKIAQSGEKKKKGNDDTTNPEEALVIVPLEGTEA